MWALHDKIEGRRVISCWNEEPLQYIHMQHFPLCLLNRTCINMVMTLFFEFGEQMFLNYDGGWFQSSHAFV
jgi:hypothetical protein